MTTVTQSNKKQLNDHHEFLRRLRGNIQHSDDPKVEQAVRAINDRLGDDQHRQRRRRRDEAK